MVIGGVCASLAFLISIAHIIRHARYNKNRPMKICTLRILIIVPFYAANAAFGLFDPFSLFKLPELLAVFRELYEAFALVAFLVFILNFLGGAEKIASEFAKQMQRPEHPFFLKVIPTYFSPGLRFVYSMIWGILQFVILMVLVTGINIVIWYFGMAVGMSEEIRKNIQLVPKAIKTGSCALAMYNLTIFYFELGRNEALKDNFERINPEMKFLAIKGVIMFTIFQSFGFDAMGKIGWLNGEHLGMMQGPTGKVATPEEVSFFFQNFLLCCEMLLFAVWHVVAYKCDEFNNDALLPRDTSVNLDSSVDSLSRTRSPLATYTYAYWTDLFRDMKNLRKKANDQKQAVMKIASGRATRADLELAFEAFASDIDGNISQQQLRYILECAKVDGASIESIISKTAGATNISLAIFMESLSPLDLSDDTAPNPHIRTISMQASDRSSREGNV